LWRLALAAALAVQLVILYAPQAPGGPRIEGLDKVIHASVFAAPAIAALVLGIRARWALGILAVHAPVSELIQHFALSSREGDVFDVIADIGGVAAGAFGFVVWNRRRP
jgi:hypothetical protein